jgi:spore coat polysaccharide biosynthesis protein SpsF
MANNILIVQARMESTRLPGKMLMRLGGKSLILNIIDNVIKIKDINKVVISIPKTSKNKELKKEINRKKVSIFEGNQNNLVDRYFKTASKYKADTILRVPGDNCFSIPREITKILNNYKKKGEEYFCSNLTPFNGSNYPDGIGAEVFSFKKIKYLKKKKLSKKKREHVHLNFIDYSKSKPVNKKFCKISTIKFKSKFNTKKIKLDINYLSDYLLMDKIYKELNYIKSKSIDNILKIYKKNEMMKIWLKKNLD